MTRRSPSRPVALSAMVLLLILSTSFAGTRAAPAEEPNESSVPPCCDWGDLPSVYPSDVYHVPSNVWLGDAVDVESGAQPDPDALGDDAAGMDDEDGVARDPWETWEPDHLVHLLITVTGSLDGQFVAWFDWDADDVLDAPIDFGWLAPGDHVLPLTIDASFKMYGTFCARFRLYEEWQTTPQPTGGVTGGEVEDYCWTEDSPGAVELAAFSAGSAMDPRPLAGLWVGSATALLATIWGSVRYRQRSRA